jgi:ribose 5-phosphate isomerase B
MKVAVASDHAGFEFKEKIKKIVQVLGYEVVDYGCYSQAESVDYPDYISKAARSVQAKQTDCAIVCCGTGIGASIVANKIRGIRAALCHNVKTVELCRAHNNANVLAIGGRVTDPMLLEDMIRTYFSTTYEGGRHQIRIDKLHHLEECSDEPK